MGGSAPPANALGAHFADGCLKNVTAGRSEKCDIFMFLTTKKMAGCFCTHFLIFPLMVKIQERAFCLLRGYARPVKCLFYGKWLFWLPCFPPLAGAQLQDGLGVMRPKGLLLDNLFSAS